MILIRGRKGMKSAGRDLRVRADGRIPLPANWERMP